MNIVIWKFLTDKSYPQTKSGTITDMISVVSYSNHVMHCKYSSWKTSYFINLNEHWFGVIHKPF